MKLTTLFILFSLCAVTSIAQNSWLTKKQVTEDIEFLSNTLDEKSSYAYLNGFNFNKDFENYLNIIEDSILLEDFGLFLTNTLAKIGDRHSSLNRIRGYELNESLFLPFIYAPINDKVIVLKKSENLEVLNPAFPYLKKIDNITIKHFLDKIRPEDIQAPKRTHFTYAVRDIRDLSLIHISEPTRPY